MASAIPVPFSDSSTQRSSQIDSGPLAFCIIEPIHFGFAVSLENIIVFSLDLQNDFLNLLSSVDLSKRCRVNPIRLAQLSKDLDRSFYLKPVSFKVFPKPDYKSLIDSSSIVI